VETISLIAPDISCEHCQRAIESALSVMPGVSAVSVDIGSQSVNVTFDGGETTRDAIVERLDEEGYPVPA